MRNLARYMFLAILSLLIIPVVGVSAQGTDYIPFPPYHVEPINKILYPRLAAPLFANPGDTFKIYVSGDYSVSAVEILDNVLGYRYGLEIKGVASLTDDRDGAEITDITVVEVSIPGDVVDGLYDIILSTSGGVFREPNSLRVLSSYPDMYVIGHMSDSHLGGWGGKYLEAYENFDRAIYTLESMGADIIVVSGDFIEQNKEQGIKHIMDLLSNLRIPFTVAPGNTDYSFNTKGLYLIEKYLAPDSSMVYMGNALIINIDAETGDISQQVVYDWIESTLERYRDISLKILNSHYPNWDPNVVSQKFIDFFRGMNEKYGISLFLNGHIHRNSVKVSETTGILTVTTTSTEVAPEFLGFRVLYGYADGSVEVPDDTVYDVKKFYVRYSQINVFQSTGQSALVVNGLSEEVSLRLYFKLVDNGLELLLNGSPVSEGVYRFSDDGVNYRTLVLDVTIAPGEKRVYVVSQGKDESPPTASVSVDGFKQYYYLIITAEDEGTGVAGMDVFYSLDNETWIACEYVVIDSWPYPTAPRDLPGFYYKIVLWDYSGNSATIYGVYGTPGEEAPGEGGPAGITIDLNILAIVGAVIAVVVVVIAVLRRR